MNVDVQIYMNQFIKFFQDNPNDLMDLIGKAKETDFYEGVKKIAQKNWEDGNEIQLTQKQLIALILELNGKVEEINVKVPMMITSYGNIFLN